MRRANSTKKREPIADFVDLWYNTTMKDFYKAREALDEEAVEYLKGTLFADRPDDCPSFIHFGIAVYDKNHWPNEYQKGLSCFKTLFHAGEERFRIVLRNMIATYYLPNTQICREDFSKEEAAFIHAALKADREPTRVNVNRPIGTERLLLRAVGEKDLKIFADHFKQDGDFAFFTGLPATKRNIAGFTLRLRSYTNFAIERKSDHKLLGYIGLSLKEQSATGLLEYYVFQEERRKGYCGEAVTALTDITLRGKLYAPVETVQIGVFGRKAIRLNAIRARIASLNTASQRTVAHCGFIHEATIHQILQRGATWTDEEIYYLTRAMIENGAADI